MAWCTSADRETRASLVALAFTMSVRQADSVLLPAVYLEVEEEFGVSAFQLGLSSFAAGVTQALISPAAAVLATRWRRPGVIAFGCGLWGVATILVGLSPSWPFLIAARVVNGAYTVGALAHVSHVPSRWCACAGLDPGLRWAQAGGQVLIRLVGVRQPEAGGRCGA